MTEAAPPAMDARAILATLPHRYPFLLIDRMLEVEPAKRAVAIKNVTFNEPQFQGHYPERPIMPGVLIVEALAQVGGALMLSEEMHKGKLPLFAGIDGCRFRRVVQPGDQLRMEVTILRARAGSCKLEAKATVDGELACEATLLFMLAE